MSGKPNHPEAPRSHEREPTEAELRKSLARIKSRQKTDGPRVLFQRHVAQVLTTSIKFKNSMLKRNLKRARATCPRCGVVGALQGSLAGPRNHMRMWCQTINCSMEMME